MTTEAEVGITTTGATAATTKIIGGGGTETPRRSSTDFADVWEPSKELLRVFVEEPTTLDSEPLWLWSHFYFLHMFLNLYHLYQHDMVLFSLFYLQDFRGTRLVFNHVHRFGMEVGEKKKGFEYWTIFILSEMSLNGALRTFLPGVLQREETYLLQTAAPLVPPLFPHALTRAWTPPFLTRPVDALLICFAIKLH